MLNFEVKSKFGNYNVEFCSINTINIAEIGTHFIIDKTVVDYYNINLNNAIIINANESEKSYQAADSIIDTDLTRKNLGEAGIKKILERVPINRLGHPADISEYVYWLCTQNSYITGQNIVIDGGFTCA